MTPPRGAVIPLQRCLYRNATAAVNEKKRLSPKKARRPSPSAGRPAAAPGSRATEVVPTGSGALRYGHLGGTTGRSPVGPRRGTSPPLTRTVGALRCAVDEAVGRKLRHAGLKGFDRALRIRGIAVPLADLVGIARIRRVDLVLQHVLRKGRVALFPGRDQLRDARASREPSHRSRLVVRIEGARVVTARVDGGAASAGDEMVLAVEDAADQPGDRAHADATARTGRILRDRGVRLGNKALRAVDRRILAGLLVERRRLAVGRLEGRLPLFDVALDHRGDGLRDEAPDLRLAALGRLVARRVAAIVAEGHRTAARIDTLTGLVAVVADRGPCARRDGA